MENLSTTSADGTTLALKRWHATGTRVGAALIVPGLAEHYGRYEHVAAALTRAGFDATLVELRGHGGSEGKRGHVDAWSQYEDDLRAAIALMDGPFSIVAHSMGGLVLLSALQAGLDTGDNELKGLVISNPLLGVAVKANPVLVGLAGLLSVVLPRLSLPNEIDVGLLSRDPEVGRAYAQDPKVYSTITPRWFTECNKAMARVHASAGSYTLPLLMLLGTGDQICAHPDAAAFVERYGGADKEQVTYEGYYHELFNEPEKDEILETAVGWLRRRDGEATDMPAS